MHEPFAGRTARLRRAMVDASVDATVVSPGPNLRYLTGFAGEPDRHLLVIVTDEETTAVTPGAYAGQVEEHACVDRVRSVPSNDAGAVALGVAEERPPDDLDLRLDPHARFDTASELRGRLPHAEIRPADDLFRPLRLRKDDAELAALRESAAVADAVSEAVRAHGADAIGSTERELAVEIRSRLHARGARRVAFDVVVGSGPNGARPDLRHGDRTIEPGDPVVLDFGAVVDGYASDQTRTVVFDGEPPSGFVEAHEAVSVAIDAGVEAVEPGIEAAEVDRVVRAVLGDCGYGDAFAHDTGHGVGLEAHEPPWIGPGSTTVLDAGMVFSVEPGVYLDEFGVRLEDLVVVTQDGSERLNDSPRGWRSP